MRTTQRLRRHVTGDGIAVAPGVFDGLSARLASMAGFEMLYVTGGGIARSTGVPDLGLLDVSEIVRRLEQIVDVADIPVIADADTGYGNALNARRAARAFERAGVAALHIEDQTFPKRCGHYEDKSLVPVGEFQQKLRAVRDALHDPDFVLIARTDAIAVEGFEAALERAEAYVEAGADMVFVEAPRTIEEIEKVATQIPYPKLINMFHGGKTPLVPVSRLAELGYRLVIVPGDMQRAAIRAMQRVLETIRDDGDSSAIVEEMAPFQERERVVDTAAWLELDRRFSA